MYAAPFAGFRYTHRLEESKESDNANSSTTTEEKPFNNNKKKQEHEQEQRENHRGKTVRRALLSKAPLVDIPETAVANRDRNLKEEVVRDEEKD